MVTQRVAWSSVASCPLDKPTEPIRVDGPAATDKLKFETLSHSLGSHGPRRTRAEEGM